MKTEWVILEIAFFIWLGMVLSELWMTRFPFGLRSWLITRGYLKRADAATSK